MKILFFAYLVLAGHWACLVATKTLQESDLLKPHREMEELSQNIADNEVEFAREKMFGENKKGKDHKHKEPKDKIPKRKEKVAPKENPIPKENLNPKTPKIPKTPLSMPFFGEAMNQQRHQSFYRSSSWNHALNSRGSPATSWAKKHQLVEHDHLNSKRTKVSRRIGDIEA